MGEDSYLDASYEDRYDGPYFDYPDYGDDEDFGDEFVEDDEDDFPLYLEYPDENLEELEPPF